MSDFLTEDLVWVEPRGAGASPGCPALFLDRDGVVVVEKHYLHDPAGVEVQPGIPELVARARAAGWAVVMVTNQSGIGRGLYGWEAFAATQQALYAALPPDAFDLVVACAHHPEGQPPYRHPDPPCRKPNPGMFEIAIARLQIDRAASAVVGDRALDLQAGKAAGLGRGVLLGTGYGGAAAEQAAARALAAPGFRVDLGEMPAALPALGLFG
jgi:D-glycero-D-manno-heptose 1,7-bisphosphate phosphatase